MSKWGWGETLALVGIAIAIAAFVEPEVRCMVGLKSESCSLNQDKTQEKANNQPETPTETPISPKPIPTISSTVSDKHVAIAYSLSTGATGYGQNYATSEAAERRALRECENYSGSGDCKLVVSAKNSCAVIATASNRAYGWARNVNLSLAKQNALRQCVARGLGCQIRHTICSS